MPFLLTLVVFLATTAPIAIKCQEFRELGQLSDKYGHDVSGTVYARNGDDDTIFIADFTYDGGAPDAFFYVGTGKRPIEGGVRLNYPSSSGGGGGGKREQQLGPFGEEDDGRPRRAIELKLPAGIRLTSLKWLSVWCRKYGINFGDVYFNNGATKAAATGQLHNEV